MPPRLGRLNGLCRCEPNRRCGSGMARGFGSTRLRHLGRGRLYIAGASPLIPTIWGHKVYGPSTGAGLGAQVFCVNESLTSLGGARRFNDLGCAPDTRDHETVNFILWPAANTLSTGG